MKQFTISAVMDIASTIMMIASCYALYSSHDTAAIVGAIYACYFKLHSAGYRD